MKKIGLLSDTHAYLDKNIFDYFAECDEIWHAGDIGTIELIHQLEAFRPVRAVYGNIDGKEIRARFPLDERFTYEGMNIWITHIGGYPPGYNRRVRSELARQTPDLFIAGHSHILKIMPDKKNKLLYINPGACGNLGFHRMKTIVRFAIHQGKIQDLEVIELDYGAGLPKMYNSDH